MEGYTYPYELKAGEKMVSRKEKIYSVLIFLFSSIVINLSCYITLKIMDEEIYSVIGIMSFFFNLFMSKNISNDYLKMKIRLNIERNLNKVYEKEGNTINMSK